MALITTTKGMMEESDLTRKRIIIDEDDNELTHTIEYYLEDELVHRSVHVQLKRNILCESIAAEI